MKTLKQIFPHLMLVLGGITLVNGGTAQAQILIDDFTSVIGDEQAVQRGGTGTQIAISEQPGTTTGFPNGIIGGYRDLWLQSVVGTTTSSTRTAAGSVGEEVLSFSNGSNVQSWLNVTWDGNDTGTVGTNTNPGPGNNSANPSSLGTPTNPGTFADTANDLRRVRRNGLGIQDLTNGGLLNSIAVEVISADLGLQLELTVYDTNLTGISRATYTFSQGVDERTIVYFPFNQIAANILPPTTPRGVFGRLSGTNPPSAARFTHIGAINLALKATRTDVDAQLRLLRPANTIETTIRVPEPSVSLLALSTMTATGFLTLKKRSRAK